MNPAPTTACGFPHRDGTTYLPERDGARLDKQHNRILALMRDGEWHTLDYLHRMSGDPEASCSSRLRDLRKARFGAHIIERRYVRRGLWEYRLVTGQLELIAKTFAERNSCEHGMPLNRQCGKCRPA